LCGKGLSNKVVLEVPNITVLEVGLWMEARGLFN
jgi:hypothetical protein